ncbi:receptor-like protein 7 [Cannabis sativa]|uniref:receptor-like protein 7 n=1 Tax=Cannabis sativa TaxID=3483 RepID=UPI0011E005DA|nr:receptor-like protein 7 [Cannabis sativa]
MRVIHQFSWLFFIPFSLILLLTVNLHTVSSQCLNDQKSLLLQLKNNLTFNTILSTKLVTWSSDQSSDCKAWKGVTFNGEGLVTGLNLSLEWISGGLHNNSTLFNLQHLKSLDLSWNIFNNILIPNEIGKLSNLSHLNLAYAGFVGQVPFTISHLTNLVTLDITTLQGKLNLDSIDFGVMVQNLSKLEEMYFDGVNLSSSSNDWCKALSSSVPKLRVLSLSSCDLSGPLDESLGNLHSLSVIRLDYNNLSSTVPTSFSNFSNLTSLILNSNKLYGNFPEKIFQIPTLQNIDLSMNSLLHGVLPDFPQSNSLQTLELLSSNFSGALPTSIGNLKNLSKLDISACNFSGELPSSLAKLNQLMYLGLSYNKFTGQIPSFNMAKNLTEINLSHNSHGGTIPAALFALPSLQKIQLSNNNFSGQVVGFSNPSSSLLDTLDLSSNNLEGPLPKSIFKLRNLKILSLSSNKFNGTLQFDVIQRLVNLTSLDLSYNNLSINTSGKYSKFLSFPQFNTLMLASCKLTTFPDLKNQSKLAILDLSNNQFHGEIPNWIWGLESLMVLNLSHNSLMSLQEPYALSPFLFILDLHSNQLHGKIPILPPASTYIDLSINNFTSSIPVDIGNHLNGILFFSVSKNHLTGIIPESICNASSLIKVLDLSYNNLDKEIPECLYDMTQNLEVLNLRNNNFRGSIPNAFPVNCSLETLDLNGNSLQGKIPNSLSSCNKLEVLDLGNNFFIGEFPCLLRNISTLQVLVLQSNKFHGSIRCLNSNESWKVLQIMDLANNDFDGTIPDGSFIKLQAMLQPSSKINRAHLDVQYDNGMYYQDSVTVSFKGREMELVKILTVFTSIDLSFNHFVGAIPEELGQLQALYFLNLSNNALIGQIPSSIGNMAQLESLDLSSNKLNGSIPVSLANLNFLAFLNLSYNDLTGLIPSGNQIQTFPPESFVGNKGLRGCPLTDDCGKRVAPRNTTKKNGSEVENDNEIDWNLISAEIGLIVGFGAVILPLVFCKRWRIKYFECIDDVGVKLFPQLYITNYNKNRRERRRRHSS